MRAFNKWLKRIKQIYKVISFIILRDENIFLSLIKEEAESYLEECQKYNTHDTEEIQDLLFHVQSYNEIPKSIKNTLYPDLKGVNIEVKRGNLVLNYEKEVITEEDINIYTQYLTDVEIQRAVERDIIFDYLKRLPIGFKL